MYKQPKDAARSKARCLLQVGARERPERTRRSSITFRCRLRWSSRSRPIGKRRSTEPTGRNVRLARRDFPWQTQISGSDVKRSATFRSVRPSTRYAIVAGRILSSAPSASTRCVVRARQSRRGGSVDAVRRAARLRKVRFRLHLSHRAGTRSGRISGRWCRSTARSSLPPSPCSSRCRSAFGIAVFLTEVAASSARPDRCRHRAARRHSEHHLRHVGPVRVRALHVRPREALAHRLISARCP